MRKVIPIIFISLHTLFTFCVLIYLFGKHRLKIMNFNYLQKEFTSLHQLKEFTNVILLLATINLYNSLETFRSMQCAQLLTNFSSSHTPSNVSFDMKVNTHLCFSKDNKLWDSDSFEIKGIFIEGFCKTQGPQISPIRRTKDKHLWQSNNKSC